MDECIIKFDLHVKATSSQAPGCKSSVISRVLFPGLGFGAVKDAVMVFVQRHPVIHDGWILHQTSPITVAHSHCCSGASEEIGSFLGNWPR